MAARAAPARRTRGRRGCTRVLVRRRPPSGGRLRAPAREPLQGTAPEPRLGLNGGAAAAEAPRAPRRAGRVRADWAHTTGLLCQGLLPGIYARRGRAACPSTTSARWSAALTGRRTTRCL